MSILLPFFYIGPGELCGHLLELKIEAKEQEDDGKWNHLLLSTRTPAIACGGEDGVNKIVVSGEVYLSMSQVDDPLPFAEGSTFSAFVKAKCDSGLGFTKEDYQFRVWTCDVTSLELPK